MELLFSLLLCFSPSTQAAQVEFNNPKWNLTVFPKNSSQTPPFGADFALDWKARTPNTALTTVFGHKLGAVPIPHTETQWRELLLKNKGDFRSTGNYRIIMKNGQSRYIAVYVSDSMDVPIYSLVMGTVVKGQVYAFYYQAPDQIFSETKAEIFKLYQTVNVELN